MPSYAQNAYLWLRDKFNRSSQNVAADLNRALRMLAQWRAWEMTQVYFQRHGRVVMQGPFAGMAYVDEATEGALLPRLIGTYESELHPALERFIAEKPEVIIDVGCAEGYYAVGLARRLPGTEVFAHDTDPKAQAACTAMAAANGLSDRVHVGGMFAPQDFQQFAGRRCLVVVDIEGGELDLLRPDLAPALAGFDIIVETHDVYRPGSLAGLIERFSATHNVVRVDGGHKSLPLPDWMSEHNHIDQLIAVWEWRAKPTPWLVMTPKG